MTEDQIVQHVRALADSEHGKDLSSLITVKIEHLRHYNVLNMDRAVAICPWGRSGSWLLASYLDGHEDVVLLPQNLSVKIYEFFDGHQSLSLRHKLLAYSTFSEGFFQSEFPIHAADYLAAVTAIFEIYGSCEPERLETSRAFFQFLHVAYSLALNRRPASPGPLMIYAQHWWNDALARRFVKDFPEARFLHTVRDPITAFDRMTEHWSKFNSGDATSWTISHLTKSGRPHSGMEPRTRAIRFEDLHNETAEVIEDVTRWLGLRYHHALAHSTFNGRPYFVERNGTMWSGSRPEQALRVSRNAWFVNRALLFALFSDNFRAWHYPYPKIFRHASVQGFTVAMLLFVPMKGEIAGAAAAIRAQGALGRALKCIFVIFRSRFAIMWYIIRYMCRRALFGNRVLELL